MNTYPVILYPLSIEKALGSLPPVPEPEVFPQPILQLPPKPEAPEVFIESPPVRIKFIPLFLSELGVSIISALVGSVSNSIGAGWTFFILLTVGVFWLGYTQIESYPIRLSQYREELAADQQMIKEWEQSTHQEKIKHKELVTEWERRKQNLERIYQQEVKNSQTPQKIHDWRKEACQQAFLSLNPQKFELEPAENRRGFAEYPENCRFPNLLRNYFSNDKIFILKQVLYYTPDFAYVDPENNWFSIDIEIDEPYTPRQYPNNYPLILTHCIGQDDNRNYFFQRYDWYVIRFSERQVLRYPESCCKVIAQLIYEFTGNESVLRQFANVRDLDTEQCWTEDSATNKAERQERLK